ncbi:hypothetical protein DAEQUDRAFT_333976 [Daedalea quercina L-15889]|uniref:RING-type domain-containing protein n=1 Tax=Daedalea quercina L-15889 TaxID=1314783 RepID=A0A165PMZ7_9APHY|nr:hypothetical protein DAEQUDRAFT_333976 [Daedalea quercina L-15889]
MAVLGHLVHTHIASEHLLSGSTRETLAAIPATVAKPIAVQSARVAPAISISKQPIQSDRCEICNKKTYDIQAHYDFSAQHPKCELCQKGFATTLDVQRHKASTQHAKCDVCGDSFADASDVQKHKAHVHPNIQCVQCKRSFLALEHLKHHYRDSPCHPKCSTCSIGFPDATTHQRHITDVHPAPMPAPSPPSSEESFVEVTQPDVPPQDVLETRSLPATPLACSTPGSVSSTRSMALSIKTQSDATSLSYSSRRASEPSLPSAFLAGDGASVPWADYPPDTPQSSAHEHFVHASGFIQEPPPSPSTIPSTALELSDASTSAEQSTPKSASIRTITPTETPQVRTIHVPLGRPRIERPESALSYASQHASISQLPLPQQSPVAASQEASHAASEEILAPRTVPHAVREVRSRSSSVASGGGRRRDISASTSLPSVATSEASGSQKSTVTSQGTTVAPAKAAPPVKPASSSTVSWHCRSCLKDPCDEPTATICGHIFCHQCIMKELATSMACPVCKKMFLLRLLVESV